MDEQTKDALATLHELVARISEEKDVLYKQLVSNISENSKDIRKLQEEIVMLISTNR